MSEIYKPTLTSAEVTILRGKVSEVEVQLAAIESARDQIKLIAEDSLESCQCKPTVLKKIAMTRFKGTYGQKTTEQEVFEYLYEAADPAQGE